MQLSFLKLSTFLAGPEFYITQCNVVIFVFHLYFYNNACKVYI